MKKITIIENGVERGVDVSKTTATPEKVLMGYTFTQADGTEAVGSYIPITDVTNIQSEKSVTITENSVVDVLPDSGFDSVYKVNVNVSVPIPEQTEGYQMSLSDDGTVLNFVWGGAKKEISFTIDGTEYKALEGMTWGEWVESDYRGTVYLWYVSGSNIECDGANYHYIIDNVTPTDVIVANTNYTVTDLGGGGSGN